MIDIMRYMNEVCVDNGMVRVFEHPHTPAVAHLESACCVSKTAMYYFICKYFNLEINGENIVREISKLQDTDKDSKTFGNLRWYREQKEVIDQNAAFFGLQPLALAYILYPERLTQEETKIILSTLEKGGSWFEKECKTGGYAYTNKEAGSGSALLLIAIATQNENLKNSAYDFWSKFIDYTEKRGWGWGENASKGYAKVTNRAFEVVLASMNESEELYHRINKLRNSLLDYLEYHEDYEMVPTIRTYNYEGKAKTYGLNINMSEEELIKKTVESDEKLGLFDVYSFILHKIAPKYIYSEDKSNFRKERLFDNSYAYTYKGENIRLGVTSHFPVVPNCAQEKGWGLAWQSMPVAVCAMNHETSFLRFAAECDGKLRTHPTMNRHFSVVNGTELFADENIPDEHTFAEQSGNTAVVVRSIKNLANKASYLADEWVAKQFDGKLEQYNDWVVFNYGDCILAVKSFNNSVKVEQNGKEVRVSQIFYEGKEKYLVNKNVITTWAIVVIDEVRGYKKELDSIKTSFEEKTDLEIPRRSMPFEITCGKAKILYDPDAYEFL